MRPFHGKDVLHQNNLNVYLKLLVKVNYCRGARRNNSITRIYIFLNAPGNMLNKFVCKLSEWAQ